jgi:nitroimidazol reductase NimA-like FMN-containing flavoprotein (pyridoxamine 5'-phosphate oxidase superfamily)
MSLSQVESLVADAPVSAHVATAVDDRPHVAPVWYGYRDGVLYFLTGGRKLDNLRRNPRVAVSIEDARGADVRWNVTLLGTATVTDDPDRLEWAEGWMYDRYERDDDAEEGSESGTIDEAEAQQVDEDEGGEDDADGVYALVEVEVGSAAVSTYD